MGVFKAKMNYKGFEGLILIKPQLFEDDRGFFFESYNLDDFKKLGISTRFIQDNHSKSSKGVLRGMHLQIKHAQAKLIRVLNGRIFDVVIDLRVDSKTYMKWIGLELTSSNQLQLFIPKGFAHGFLSMEDDTHVLYKVNEYWSPQDEIGILWNDSDFNIEWPVMSETQYIISNKDKSNKLYKDVKMEITKMLNKSI